VDVYRFLATGTLEEMMYCRQLYKLQLGNEALENVREERLFAGVQGSKRAFGSVDMEPGDLFGLRNLLQFSPHQPFMHQLQQRYNWKPSLGPASSATAAAAAGGGSEGEPDVIGSSDRFAVMDLGKVDWGELAGKIKASTKTDLLDELLGVAQRGEEEEERAHEEEEDNLETARTIDRYSAMTVNAKDLVKERN
jgi:hypothetical protein